MNQKVDKHSKRYWDNRDVPNHEQFIQALKDAGLYKKSGPVEKARREDMKRLLKEAADWRSKHSNSKE